MPVSPIHDRAHQDPDGEDDAVEQPLGEQRAGGDERRDAVVLADRLDAEQVAAAGREDVVRGRADAEDREQPLGRGLVAGGREEVAPAERDRDAVQEDEAECGGHRPPGQAGDLVPGVAEVGDAQEEPEERAGGGRADASRRRICRLFVMPGSVSRRRAPSCQMVETSPDGRVGGERAASVAAALLEGARSRSASASTPSTCSCGGSALAEGATARPPERARIVALERRLGIHVEPRIQQVFLPQRRLVASMNVAYGTLNVGLTALWLHAALRATATRVSPLPAGPRCSACSAPSRSSCSVPTAPPRKLDHLVDTIAEVSGIDLDSGFVAKLYHPLAAMPSIHMTIAVVTAEGIRQTRRSPSSVRSRPPIRSLVAGVVLATANHYVLDVVVGYGLGKAALAAAKRLGA